MPDQIERWIICIAGFREEGHLSGTEVLHDALRLQHSSDDTIVLLKSWKDSMPHIAERIYNRRPVGHPPRLIIVGYSYGGYSASLLGVIFQKYKWDVEYMALIDPVARFFPRIPSSLSLLDFWKIKITDNVNVLDSWHQEITNPHGHKLKVNREKTDWLPQTLTVPHRNMDDVEAIYDRVLRRAA